MYPESKIYIRWPLEENTISSLCKLLKEHEFDMILLDYNFGKSQNDESQRLNWPSILKQCIKQWEVDLSNVFVIPTTNDKRTDQVKADYKAVWWKMEHKIPKDFNTYRMCDRDENKAAQELIESLLFSKYGKSSGQYGWKDEYGDDGKRWD